MIATQEAEGFDRMLIAMASYNVGPGHVADAQELAEKQGKDPHKWSSLKNTLPLAVL
jgi:membrane-bound lytic murein transglycosylase F